MLFAKPLDTEEVEKVRSWLGDDLFEVFRSQQVADQRHGYEAGAAVARRGHRPELVAAAALHDVGKRHSLLGPFRRSMATVLMALRIPMQGRWAAYRDHGPLGAADLQSADASRLVVDFARHHQYGRPCGITPDDWAVLNAADLGTLPEPRA